MGYRDHLPQLDGGFFLTDGGIETSLIFHDGLDLPLFAAFALLENEDGTAYLRRYFEPYLALASERGAGFVLESPTWRASPRWAHQLGYDDEQLDGLNRRAIALMEALRAEHGGREAPVVISGCVGPQDDGYDPDTILSPDGRAAIPRHADRNVRRHRGRHGHRDHDDLRGRGDRHHARRG